MLFVRTSVSLIVGALAAVSSARAEPTLAERSLAAGYKAAFICSATFNAGRTPEQIDGDELARIYPGLREALGETGAAQIIDPASPVGPGPMSAAAADRTPRVVVPVAGAPGARTRTAVWRPYLGCVQTPDGADYGAVSGVLPFVSGLAPPKDAPPLPASRRLFPALEAAVAGAFDRETFGAGTETTAVLIVRDGTIVAERYRDGFDAQTPQRTWSVAKSIAATIIGAAVQDGLIAVDEPAGLEAWSTPGDPRAAITIENLLHMASGLDAGAVGSRTHDVYFGGGRVIDHAVTNRLIAEPGARWFYANNDTMAAIRALRERLEAAQGPGAHLRYPFEALLGPLGMRATFLETDWNGDFVLSSQVWTTARDLARLGLLYLGDGVWNGRRILPEGWAAYVATPAPAQPPNPGRFGYGAQFWLAGPDSGLPAGTYAAFGNRGQHLVIIPERNMLVVRRGFDEIGGTRFDIAAFVRDILAASEESAP